VTGETGIVYVGVCMNKLGYNKRFIMEMDHRFIGYAPCVYALHAKEMNE
jgi:hypothetical protein